MALFRKFGGWLKRAIPKAVGVGTALITGGLGAGVVSAVGAIGKRNKTTEDDTGGLSEKGSADKQKDVGGLAHVVDDVRSSIDRNDVRVSGGVSGGGGTFTPDSAGGSVNLVPVVIGLLVLILIFKKR
ncbi:MAG: hypothetical protein ACQEQ0_08695 [Bacteroidota bacterium]